MASYLLKEILEKLRIVLISLILLGTINSQAQSWYEVTRTVTTNRTSGDLFGFSVSISGNYAVIGAAGEREDASESNSLLNAGAAYILKKEEAGSNWVQIKKLVASDRVAFARFGLSVSISGDYVIVGAPGESRDASGGNVVDGSGAVYIFEKDQGGTDNWGEVTKLVASDRAEYDNLGSSISITGDYLIAGAESKRDGGLINVGAAYIFKKDGTDNWVEIKKLIASDKDEGVYFGNAVSITDDYAIVGAFGEREDAIGNNTIINAGAAYLFSKNEGGTDNWGQIKKLVASDRLDDDTFGTSVSISGDYIVVGAPGEDDDILEVSTFANLGAVYMFSRNKGGLNNWGQVKKITASDRAEGDAFGTSVCISDSYLIVGAPNEDEDWTETSTVTNAGSVYIFQQSQEEPENWEEVRKINASDREEEDFFGYFVSLSEGKAIVGAYGEGNSGVGYDDGIGAVYVFKVAPRMLVSQGTRIVPDDSTYDFGKVVQGTQSSDITFTIQNIGLGDLIFSEIGGSRIRFIGSNASNFTLLSDLPEIVPQGESAIFQIRFSPTNLGLHEATILLTHNIEDQSTYSPNLVGEGVESNKAILEVSEGETVLRTDVPLNFPTIIWETSVEKTFTIRNIGTADLVLSGNPLIFLAENEQDFIITEQPALSTIPSGSSTEFKIKFTPQSAGEKTNRIVISSNDNDFSTPILYELKGVGINEFVEEPVDFFAESISGEEIRVSWVYENFTGLGNTVLYKSLTNQPDSYSTLAIVPTKDGLSSYSDNTLLAGQTAYYKIQAFREKGASQLIGPISITTFTPPKMPSDLQATTTSPSKIFLTWKDESNNETGFEIERSIDSDENFKQLTIISDDNVNFFQDSGLENGKKYFYRVRAIQEINDGFSDKIIHSDYSNLANARASAVPAIPTELTASIDANNDVLLNWQDNATNEDNFLIERLNNLEGRDSFIEIAQLSANTTTFIDETVIPNQLYQYRVRATIADVTSSASNIYTIETPFNPNITKPSILPQDLEATPVSFSQINLSWRPVTEGVDFTVNNFVRIEMATNVTGPFTEIAQLPITKNTHSVTALSQDRIYYFRIRFGNDGGNSAYSDVVNALPECRLVVAVSDDKENIVSSVCDGKSALLQVSTNAIEADYQWSRDGLTLPNSNQPFFHATESGKYSCVVSAGGGCIATSSDSVTVVFNEAIAVTIHQNDSLNLLEANLTNANLYQWYKDESPIEGANSAQFIPIGTGLYYIVVTQGNCSATSNFIFVANTGINEEISKEIVLFPNPTSDYLELNWENEYLGDYSLSIYDLTGKKYDLKDGTKSSLVLQEKLDLSAFQEGLYILELVGEGFQAIKKVIKQ